VSASLKLGFAVAINSLINGFRAAVSFLCYFITDGSMWKGLGTLLLGLAASFGLAILNAFEMPITYSTGTLDAQRENNRLTGQTNDLLKDLNKTVGKLGGTKQAAFG
jgi:hypothetical protein